MIVYPRARAYLKTFNYMTYDRAEISEILCPKCKQDYLLEEPCNSCEDGYFVDDFDPLYPVEISLCEECVGSTWVRWCKCCGYVPDRVFYSNLSDDE